MVRHPVRTTRLAGLATRRMLEIHPDELGTSMRRGSDAVHHTTCRWCPLRAVTRSVAPAGPILVPGLVLGALLVARRVLRRSTHEGVRSLANLGLLGLVGSIAMFGVAISGNGYYELTKHLFASIVLLALAWWAMISALIIEPID